MQQTVKNSSITEIVIAAQQGDREAFERLAALFQDRAFAIAYASLGDYHLAEDAAQEAFVEAFLHLSELKAPSAFGAWFRQIVFGKCVRLIRSSKALSVLSLDAAAHIASGTPGPAQAVEEREKEKALHAALLALPEHERAAVTLFYIGGYSYQELASFQAVPLSTVKKRLYSARQRLRVLLPPEGEDNLPVRRPSRDPAFTQRVQQKRAARLQQTQPKPERKEAIKVEVREHCLDDKAVIKNLFTFYRYDLMPYLEEGAGAWVNQYGVLNGEHSRTHEEGVQGEDGWWEKPGVLWAFLIRAEGRPAGFAMVAAPPHATRGVNYRMNEFFILNKFRRQGVGTRAAIAVLDKLRGKWEIGLWPANQGADAFWRKVVPAYTGGNYQEGLVGMGPVCDSIPGLLLDNTDPK